MSNFIKKIAYYDGLDYLKQSIAQTTPKQKGSPLIFHARRLLKQVPQVISTITSKPSLYKYICDDAASKQDFELLDSMSNLMNSIRAMSATEKNPDNKQAYDLVVNSLKRGITGIKGRMGSAYAEIRDLKISNKMTEQEYQSVIAKLRQKIDNVAPQEPQLAQFEKEAPAVSQKQLAGLEQQEFSEKDIEKMRGKAIQTAPAADKGLVATQTPAKLPTLTPQQINNTLK